MASEWTRLTRAHPSSLRRDQIMDTVRQRLTTPPASIVKVVVVPARPPMGSTGGSRLEEDTNPIDDIGFAVHNVEISTYSLLVYIADRMVILARSTAL